MDLEVWMKWHSDEGDAIDYWVSVLRYYIPTGIYILAIPPSPGGQFCPNWKTGKNLKEDFMKKVREKGGKRVLKHTLNTFIIL